MKKNSFKSRILYLSIFFFLIFVAHIVSRAAYEDERHVPETAIKKMAGTPALVIK